MGPGVSSSSATKSKFVPLSKLEEAEFTIISLDEPSHQPAAVEQPGESISSFSSVPPHVAKAKWKEFLELLKLGYGKLIIDPDKERKGEALFQEICSGNPSFMPSDELQETADDFAIGFVDAVDTIRTNIHQLPFLLLSEQPTVAAKDVLYAKRRDVALFFEHYKAIDLEITKIRVEEKELEDKLKVVQDKLATR